MPRVRLARPVNDGPTLGTPAASSSTHRGPRRICVAPVLRLMTRGYSEPEPGSRRTAVPRMVDALIDTGAWVSVLARDTWEDYEHDGLLRTTRTPDGRIDLSPATSGRIGGATRRPTYVGKLLDAGDRSGHGPPPPTGTARHPVIAQLLLNRKATPHTRSSSGCTSVSSTAAGWSASRSWVTPIRPIIEIAADSTGRSDTSKRSDPPELSPRNPRLPHESR